MKRKFLLISLLIIYFSNLFANEKVFFEEGKKLFLEKKYDDAKFKFEKDYVVLPNSLAISYALGISTSGNAKNIYLAGLDGYNSINLELPSALTILPFQFSKLGLNISTDPFLSTPSNRYVFPSIFEPAIT